MRSQLADEWESFWLVCQEQGMPPEARETLRKTFYSGAVSTLMLMTHDRAALREVNDEIRNFIEQQRQAHAARH